MAFKLGKNEKLKSKKLIEQLFKEGRTITKYPVKLIYLNTTPAKGPTFKAGVSVPKKNFKSAIQRNRIKRLMRESYRLNKHHIFNNIEGNYAFLFLYIGKEMCDYSKLEESMMSLFNEFLKKVSNAKVDE